MFKKSTTGAPYQHYRVLGGVWKENERDCFLIVPDGTLETLSRLASDLWFKGGQQTSDNELREEFTKALEDAVQNNSVYYWSRTLKTYVHVTKLVEVQFERRKIRITSGQVTRDVDFAAVCPTSVGLPEEVTPEQMAAAGGGRAWPGFDYINIRGQLVGGGCALVIPDRTLDVLRWTRWKSSSDETYFRALTDDINRGLVYFFLANKKTGQYRYIPVTQFLGGNRIGLRIIADGKEFNLDTGDVCPLSSLVRSGLLPLWDIPLPPVPETPLY